MLYNNVCADVQIAGTSGWSWSRCCCATSKRSTRTWYAGYATASNILTLRPLQIDVSKQVIDRTTAAGYSLLDVNLFPKPATSAKHKVRIGHRDARRPAVDSYTHQSRYREVKEDWSKEVMVYLWDNYIQYVQAVHKTMLD